MSVSLLQLVQSLMRELPREVEPPIARIDSNSAPIRWNSIDPEPTTTSQPPQWQKLTDDPDNALPEAVVWSPLETSIAADIEKRIKKESPIQEAANTEVTIQLPVIPSGATFANDKAMRYAYVLKSAGLFRGFGQRGDGGSSF